MLIEGKSTTLMHLAVWKYSFVSGINTDQACVRCLMSRFVPGSTGEQAVGELGKVDQGNMRAKLSAILENSTL